MKLKSDIYAFLWRPWRICYISLPAQQVGINQVFKHSAYTLEDIVTNCSSI